MTFEPLDQIVFEEGFREDKIRADEIRVCGKGSVALSYAPLNTLGSNLTLMICPYEYGEPLRAPAAATVRIAYRAPNIAYWKCRIDHGSAMQ